MSEKTSEYDEDQALTRYIWNNYMDLMSDTERLVARVARLRAKANASESTKMRDTLLERARALEDKHVEAALQDGFEPFRHAVRKRLLKHYPRRIDLNRCPRCDRIPKTPRAKQCPWCFYSWHSGL